jgi:hypothetical protein
MYLDMTLDPHRSPRGAEVPSISVRDADQQIVDRAQEAIRNSRALLAKWAEMDAQYNLWMRS